MLNFFMETFTFLFILMEPFAVLPIFIALTREDTPAERLKVALRASLVSCILLLFVVFLGEKTLDFLGITTSALKVSGGILLIRLAIDMLQTGGEPPPANASSDERSMLGPKPDVAIFPLAIPLLSGPGAITGVIVRMRETGGKLMLQAMIILAILVVAVITYGVLAWSTQVGRLLGPSGTNIVVRVFGIILAALACELILSGVSKGLHLF